jgi:hypothetical protein
MERELTVMIVTRKEFCYNGYKEGILLVMGC